MQLIGELYVFWVWEAFEERNKTLLQRLAFFTRSTIEIFPVLSLMPLKNGISSLKLFENIGV